jgi:hypothetical protein|tara:strand:- start:641 stop:769 length:129 start_codon:yes stop_codon:yes gene_type:complete
MKRKLLRIFELSIAVGCIIVIPILLIFAVPLVVVLEILSGDR